MARETKSTILVAIIGAMSAVVIAVITTYGTIAVSAPEALKVKKELEDISDLQKIANLPIGTIVPSMLYPSQFAKAVGDLDRTTSHWVLADGQKDITTSQYGQLSNKTKTPDLRGMFLRGVNEGRDDGEQDPVERKPGVYQSDALEQHGHKTTVTGSPTGYKEKVSTPSNIGYTRDPDGRNAPIVSVSVSVSEVTGAKADEDETRPKNVAVYFYIKIN